MKSKSDMEIQSSKINTDICTSFLSTPVPKHGELICITLRLSVRLSVVGPKFRQEINSYLKE